MSDAPIKCTVVSPERPLFDGFVRHAVVPGSEGELGIFPHHAPLIGSLGPGLVRLHTGTGSTESIERFAIRGGFIHVKKDVITLLVTDAVRPSDVDPAKVEGEHASVLESLRHPRSAEEYDELRRQRRWCEVRLALHADSRRIKI